MKTIEVDELKEIIWIYDGARVADKSAMGAINRPLRRTRKDGVIEA